MSIKRIDYLVQQNNNEQALQEIMQLHEEDKIVGQIYKSFIMLNERKVNEAITIVNKILEENRSLINLIQEFGARVSKTESLLRLSKPVKAFKELIPCDKLLQRMDDTEKEQLNLLEAKYYTLKGRFHTEKGDLEKGLNNYLNGLVIFEKSDNKFEIYYQLNNIGWIYRVQGKLDRAFEYFHRQLKTSNDIGDPKYVGWSTWNLGKIVFYKGDLRGARKFAEESFTIFKELKYQPGILTAYIQIASIHRALGDFDTGLEYYQKVSKFYGKIAYNNETIPHIYCVALRNIGLIYYHKNKMKKSIGNLKNAFTTHQSLCIARNTLYDFELIVVNWYLVRTSIEINDKNLAENSLKELLKIAEKWPWANIFHKAAQALVLKSKKRAKYKIQAQQILNEIVDKRFDYEFEFTIKVNLCELLLDELKFYGEEDVLQEIQKLLSSISGLAKNLRSITNLVILYSLEAKLALIEGDAELSKNMLNKALSLAVDKGMEMLMTKIEYQQNYLMSQLEEWKVMLVKNSSLQEKFELLNLKKYIETAISVVKNEFTTRQQYELVYVDLLEEQPKIQKRKCRVGIAQIGLSSTGNFLAEFYEEIAPGFFNLKLEQVERLRNKVREVIINAHSKGINILLFPELTIDLNYDLILEDIVILCKKYEMYVVPGSYHDQETDKNLSVVVAADGILWTQEKHIPATIHFEGKRFQEGIDVSIQPRKTIICNTEYGRIAIVICRDFLDMDLRVELKNVEPPVDIILNPAFTPVTADFQAAHFDARRSIYAYCYFANVAEFGNSLIYTPEKERKENIIHPKEESIIYKDVDIFNLRSERKKWEIEQKKERAFIQSTRN
ncbi:MAG: hypothetical protein ACXAD7_19760 [Candidatus Kariarchaeaceae archaeon]|jgi:predicted amidohydrolase